MIPKLLHQIWATDTVPERFSAYVESWKRHNPDWQYLWWSDRTLLEFVAKHYPDFLPVYCGYPKGVMRADAGRYLLLHHFGGVYADIDCECLAPFDRITGESRIVISKEPHTHWQVEGDWRGLPYVLFNGTIASPNGHPFWPHLIGYLRELHAAKDVLDATGPCVLTSAQLSFPDQSAFALHPPALFTPKDRDGKTADDGSETLSVHHWAGTWWTPRPQAGLLKRLRRAGYSAWYGLTRDRQFDGASARKQLKPLASGAVPSPEGSIAIFIPVRNGADHLPRLGERLRLLDHPAERIRLVFCEGDSTDDSWPRLREMAGPLERHFASVDLLQYHVGNTIGGAMRHKRAWQRARRSHIARVRNHLIERGLRDQDDWVLWIDADVWDFPTDVISTLLSAGERIVVPNCVTVPGGASFDLNSFVTRRQEKDGRYYRAVGNGLYQPDRSVASRYHLSDLRHLEKVGLDAVGGTMLLVDAALHRGGLRFPEQPYCDLIETEAFGKLAADIGVRPVGLPRVEIRHVPW